MRCSMRVASGAWGMPRFVKHMKAPDGHKLWACPCHAVARMSWCRNGDRTAARDRREALETGHI
jgi:hypothetical protein